MQRLVRAGLAERRHSDEDGRVVMVSATAAAARHEAIAGRRRKAMETMLAEFDDAERQRLADLLDRFGPALDHLADQLP